MDLQTFSTKEAALTRSLSVGQVAATPGSCLCILASKQAAPGSTVAVLLGYHGAMTDVAIAVHSWHLLLEPVETACHGAVLYYTFKRFQGLLTQAVNNTDVAMGREHNNVRFVWRFKGLVTQIFLLFRLLNEG